MSSRFAVALVLSAVVLVQVSSAVVLLTEEQALEKMFPDVDSTVVVHQELSAAQVEAVKAQLGGKWTLYQAGGTEAVEEDATIIDFHYGMKQGKRQGVALMETQPGKWGPVDYIVALDMDGRVRDLAVMMYVEKRGRPIALRSFLGQFIGKSIEDNILVGKDIQAISGATISCRATAFAVKKVVALFRTVAGPSVD